jgi:succinylglutamate desuccinylase
VSQLTTNTVQLGQDQTTDANNFVLTAPGDGSFKISAGVPGNTAAPVFEVTTTGDVLVANQSPVEVATSTAILYSIVLGG